MTHPPQNAGPVRAGGPAAAASDQEVWRKRGRVGMGGLQTNGAGTPLHCQPPPGTHRDRPSHIHSRVGAEAANASALSSGLRRMSANPPPPAHSPLVVGRPRPVPLSGSEEGHMWVGASRAPANSGPRPRQPGFRAQGQVMVVSPRKPPGPGSPGAVSAEPPTREGLEAGV